ncbi:MAG: cupin domain-containing protein [Myxococcota bacterium]
MATRAMQGLGLSVFLLGCGGGAALVEIPPIDEEETFTERDAATDEGPTAEAPVSLRLEALREGQALRLAGDACNEVSAYVESGRLQDGGATREAGTFLRTYDPLELVALEASEVVVSEVRGEGECAIGDDLTVTEPLSRSQASGAMVHIYAGEPNGGASSFAILDGVGGVPLHTHSSSSETILVIAGEGTMTVGERSHALAPGVSVHAPAGTSHEATPEGTMRVFQVYAPAGPEQRFVASPAGAAEPEVETAE